MFNLKIYIPYFNINVLLILYINVLYVGYIKYIIILCVTYNNWYLIDYILYVIIHIII